MRSRSKLFLAALSFAASTTLANAQEWSPDKQKIVDGFGTVAVNGAPGVPPQTPSMAVGISIGGEPVVQKGYGSVLGGPAGPNTLYRIASVSKQFTAATFLALVEESNGKLSLDTPLSQIVSDASQFSNGPVTFRQMLNMQSGFANYTKPPAGFTTPYSAAKPIKPNELLRVVLSMLAQNKAPGGVQPYFYSNTNYFLTAVAMERFMAPQAGASGIVNYRDLIKSRVFNKAGMTKTAFIDDNFSGVVVAPSGNPSNVDFTMPSWGKGAGEIVSTASDMLKWHKALMAGQIISKKSVATMLQPKADMGGNTFYAMGWTVLSVPPFTWVSHGGEIGGFSPFDGLFFNATTNQWVSVVVLANNDKVPVANFGACFAQLAMDPSPTQKGWSYATKKSCLLPTKFGL